MPIDPSTLPGIVLLCEADALTPVASGTAVSTWTNAVAGLGNLTNAGATGTKPTYQTGDASDNSKPFLRFVVGSSQKLTTANSGVVTEYYAVVREPGGTHASYAPPLGSNSASFTAGNCLISRFGWQSTAAPLSFEINGVAMSSDGTTLSTFPMDDLTRWKIIRVEVLNPTQSRSYTAAFDAATGLYGSWDIAAIVAFSANLGSTDKANLTAYLVGKYLPAAPAAGSIPSAYPSSGLVHYLDAASRCYTDQTAATACTDLSPVGQWSGLDGNGISWTQGKTTWQPLYLATGLNGRPCVRFNGAAYNATNPPTWLSAGIPQPLENLANGSFSVVLVGRMRQSSGTQSIIAKSNTGGDSLTWFGASAYYWTRMTAFYQASTNPASPRNKNVFCYVYTFANGGTNTGTETIYVGGVPLTTRTGSVPAWISSVGWRMGTQDGTLQASNFNFLGDLARVAVYNRALSGSEVAAIANDASLTYASARIFFEGDSLTQGSGATADGEYPAQVIGGGPGQTAWEMLDVGVAGTTIDQMLARATATVDPYLVPGQSNVVVLMTGTNDLFTRSGATEYASVISYLAARKAAGMAAGASVRTVLVLPPPFPGGTAGQETNRQAFMTLARANALTSGTVDALVDFANDPYIGLFTSKTDQPSYWSDTAHMTNAGYVVLAGHVRHALVGLLQPKVWPRLYGG